MSSFFPSFEKKKFNLKNNFFEVKWQSHTLLNSPISGTNISFNKTKFTTTTWTRLTDFYFIASFDPQLTWYSQNQSRNIYNMIPSLLALNLRIKIQNIDVLEIDKNFAALNYLFQDQDMNKTGAKKYDSFIGNNNYEKLNVGDICMARLDNNPLNEDNPIPLNSCTFKIYLYQICSFFANDEWLPPQIEIEISSFPKNNDENLIMTYTQYSGSTSGGRIRQPVLHPDNTIVVALPFVLQNIRLFYKKYIIQSYVRDNPEVWNYFTNYKFTYQNLYWKQYYSLGLYQFSSANDTKTYDTNFKVQTTIPEYLMLFLACQTTEYLPMNYTPVVNYNLSFSNNELTNSSQFEIQSVFQETVPFYLMGQYVISYLLIEMDGDKEFLYDSEECNQTFEYYLTQTKGDFLNSRNRFHDPRYPYVIPMYNLTNSPMMTKNILKRAINMRILLKVKPFIISSPTTTINLAFDDIISPFIFTSERQLFSLTNKSLEFETLPIDN